MLLTKLEENKPECFLSIQGEGRTIGKPCIFVRFSVCNLGCHYCDSAFTWNFDDIKGENRHCKNKVNRDKYQIEMSVGELIKEIKEFNCKNIVFTGGEPTIYQKDLIEIMKILRKEDKQYYFEVETNGTILFHEEFLKLIDQINCSPKLISSGNTSIMADKPQVINQIKDLSKTIFKFVICKKTIGQDILELTEWQKEYGVENSQIWLMPEGVTRKKIIEGSKMIVNNLCFLGYNLSTRLHILLWQNRRAV